MTPRTERVVLYAIGVALMSMVMAKWVVQLEWWMRAHVDQYQTESIEAIDTREHNQQGP